MVCVTSIKFKKTLGSFYGLALISIISFSFIMWLNSMYTMPPGTDPGQWLRETHALMGNITPYWERRTLLYPPFSFIILLSVIEIVKNELLALKIFGSLVFSLLPIPAYIITKKLGQDKTKAIIAALLTVVAPLFYEMWGWGAYPNLLGLFFLGMTFYFTLNIIDNPCRKNFIFALFSGFLTVYTHHITAVVFVTGFTLYVPIAAILIFLKWHGPKREARALKLLSVILLLTIFLSVPIFMSLLNNYDLTSDAPALTVTLVTALNFIFKGAFLAVPLILLALLSLFTMASPEETGARVSARLKLLLFLLWIIVPLIMTQAYIVGIRADFNRFPFFSVQPVLILAAMAPINKAKQLRKKKLRGLLVRACLIFVVIISGFFGIRTAFSANAYYHYLVTGDMKVGGDKDVYEAIMWIDYQSNLNDTILTSPELASWIEGLTGKKTLFPGRAYFMYIKGDVQKCIDAENILNNSILKYELLEKYNIRFLAILNFDPNLDGVIEDSTFELLYRTSKVLIFSVGNRTE